MPIVIALVVILSLVFWFSIKRAKQEKVVTSKASGLRAGTNIHTKSRSQSQPVNQHTNHTSANKTRVNKTAQKSRADMNRQQPLGRKRVFSQHTTRIRAQHQTIAPISVVAALAQVSALNQQLSKHYRETHTHLYEFKIEPCIEIRAKNVFSILYLCKRLKTHSYAT